VLLDPKVIALRGKPERRAHGREPELAAEQELLHVQPDVLAFHRHRGDVGGPAPGDLEQLLDREVRESGVHLDAAETLFVDGRQDSRGIDETGAAIVTYVEPQHEGGHCETIPQET
jgi:hypothetical protein